jgi:RecB family endonuclease NucS
MMGHRYIFRPLTGIVSGTLTENTEVVIQCEVALDGYSVKNRDDNIGIINQEYLFLYNCLKEYYKPQIYQHESDAKSTYKEIIDVLSGIYQIKKDEVKQETNILKILSVDELTQNNNVINIA